MSFISDRKKTVSLTFRGFDISVDEAAELVGVAASSQGSKGEQVRPSVKTILARSYVIFSLGFPDEYELCDMLPALLAHLGGVEHVCQAKSKIIPEFTEINFDIPVTLMDDISQDGYFSTDVIADVFHMKATLGLSFH